MKYIRVQCTFNINISIRPTCIRWHLTYIWLTLFCQQWSKQANHLDSYAWWPSRRSWGMAPEFKKRNKLNEEKKSYHLLYHFLNSDFHKSRMDKFSVFIKLCSFGSVMLTAWIIGFVKIWSRIELLVDHRVLCYLTPGPSWKTQDLLFDQNKG